MRRIQNYIKEVILEMKKVTWPTREELKGATVTVIVFTAVATLYVFGVDFALGKLVSIIIG